ncbi:MAG: hypothetical protein GC179_05365 [Anaerolineaceae bacterium]|nr:hypothetical protein [Anaerolineaceae bacterium]
MSRILRWVEVGLMLALTSLVMNVLPVGARWVRMGNDEVVIDIIQICDDGIKVTVANSANNYVPGFNPAPDEVLYFYRGTLDPTITFLNQLPTNELLASQNFQLGYYPNAHLKGLPVTTSFQSFPTEAEWYAMSSIKWQASPINIGDNIGVVVEHIINNNASTLMFVGNLTVLNCFISSSSNTPNQPNFLDSRIDAYHPWQPVAAYCEDKMVKVYGIDANGNGYFAFAVTQEDIDKLGIPKENTLLASSPSAFGGTIRLYKLKDTGELQINAPGLPPESWKEYVFTWAGCT